MKGIIIYKGKYGATRQYAEWLGQELNLPVVPADNFPAEKFADYDFLLIGSSVYIGKLQIGEWLKNNLDAIQNKKIFLFQVAATPPDEKEKRESYNRLSVPEEIRKSCEVFFLPGSMIIKKLSWRDRFMLKTGAWLTKDPVTRKTMLTDFNDVKKEKLAGLLNSVRKFFAVGISAMRQNETV